MKLHIFNPEHDIALAAEEAHYTAPHAARQLRNDLGFLPALWAEDGDMVLVDDVQTALEAIRHLRSFVRDVAFVSDADLARIPTDLSFIEVEPWGWDEAVKRRLIKINPTLEVQTLPHHALEKIKQLSHRHFAAVNVLPNLVKNHSKLVGDMQYFTGDARDLIKPFSKKNKHFVLKAPWSSSGRGIRYVFNDFTKHVQGWTANIISKQGGVMIEPYYPKLKDFGMEFFADINGKISYEGLSVFSTINGAYTGNLIASEKVKHDMLTQYMLPSTLEYIRDIIIYQLEPLLKNHYAGPFGVDMMILKLENQSFHRVHPCVEINLRRTMGHVAIDLYRANPQAPQQLMRIEYTDKYRLKIIPFIDDLVIPHVL